MPFAQRLQGLLGDPVFNLGVGLLSAGGPSQTPINIGQGFGHAMQFASERERQAMQSQAARQQLLQRQQQQQAQAKLQGLLTGTEPADQNQMLGLLAQASPEAFNQVLTQGLLGQMMPQEDRAEPSFIRELRAAGIDPASPEGRELVVNRARGQGASEEVLKTVQLQLQAFQLDEARRKREQEGESAAKARRALEVETQSAFGKAQELAELNEALENSALETGRPYGEIARSVIAGGAPVLERLGFDTSAAQEAVANFDRFNKLATDFGIGLIDRLRDSGTITDTKFRALQATMAGIGTSPGANRLVIADVMQAALDAADIEGIEVEGQDGIEALISQLKGGGMDDAAEPVADVPAAVSEIARMTREQLSQLDTSQMTEEALEAAAKRFGELTGG